MNRGIFYEEGVVLQVNGSEAVVLLTKNSNCSGCGARHLCQTGTGEERRLEASNAQGFLPGETVKLEVYGSRLLVASGLIYGIPLVLVVMGVWIGSILSNDLTAGILGLALPAVYGVGIWLYMRFRLRRPLWTPKIIKQVSLD